MDPLSDVLRAVRLNGAFFYRVEAAAPWSVSSVSARDLVPRVLPDAEHLIAYHILLSGSCWAKAADSAVQLKPGDVLMLPHGDAHVMSSGPHLTERDHTTSSQAYRSTVMLGPETSRDTTLVCGYLGCDVRPFNPLLAALPQVMHVPGIASGWLAEFPRQVIAESRGRGVGSETMLTRMAELMFVEVVRRHVQSLRPEHSGWLAGVRDEVVGPALTQLHERPAHRWTLASLAAAIASSRTVLSERFAQLVGIPPMTYLARWRLQLASELLLTGKEKVSTVAVRVGYESEAAFSRAFKRETGVSPGAWRQRTHEQRIGTPGHGAPP